MKFELVNNLKMYLITLLYFSRNSAEFRSSPDERTLSRTAKKKINFSSALVVIICIDFFYEK